MKSLARTYRIATSLNIAIARLREVIAAVPAGNDPHNVAILPPTVRDGNERASIMWQVEAISMTCGAWCVDVARDRATWTHAGITVIVGAGHMTATAFGKSDKSDAQRMRAMRIVGLRAAQLERELLDLKRSRVFADVIAVAPGEVLVIVNAIGAAGVEAFRTIEYHIRTLWPNARQDEGAEAALGAMQDKLIALLRDESMSYEKIARELYVSTSTVKRKARELHILGLVPARKRGRNRVKS